MNISKELCLALNNSIGVTNPAGEPPVDPDGFNWLTPFDGTFAGGGGGFISTTGNHTTGRTEACISITGPAYHYYRVLMAR